MEEISRNVDRILLINNGSIITDGTPAQVFTDTERLASLGLRAPKAAMIAARLRTLGLPLEQDIFTLEQLRLTLNTLRAKEGKTNA